MAKEKYFFEEEVFSKPNYKFMFEPDKKTIKEILKYKKKGKILELGCGEGGTSLGLAKKGFDVACMDISKTAISKIKEKAKKERIQINAICADLESYKINGKYDIIIGSGFFHFLPKGKALKLIGKCRAHTKKGGINIFIVMLKNDPSQEKDSKGYYFPKYKLKEIYSDWDIKAYQKYEEYDKKEGWNNKLEKIIAVKKYN